MDEGRPRSVSKNRQNSPISLARSSSTPRREMQGKLKFERFAMKNSIGKFLIEGARPLIVLPELAEEVGLEAAVILQQLHFLLRDGKNGKVLSDGNRWIYNSYKGWREHFPWMTEITLRRVFTRLEKEGAIKSCRPRGDVSRRKYYRLIRKANASKSTQSEADQIDPNIRSN